MTSNISAFAWVCTFLSLSLPDGQGTEQRMSFSVSQLNDALKHASLTQLICVYLEIAAWRPWWRWVGGHCTCSTDRPTQQQQSRGSYDGQRLIRGSPEWVGFALMPQGFVKAANISAYGANTPRITYLFILSG